MNKSNLILVSALALMLLNTIALADDAPKPDPIVDEFNRQKARSDAEAAAYTAAINAHKLEVERSIGTITAPGSDAPTGAISFDANTSNAGKAEATLLAGKALIQAGTTVANNVCAKVRDKNVVLVVGPNALQFVNYQQFDLRIGLLKSESDAAFNSYNKARKDLRDTLHIDPDSIRVSTIPFAAAAAASLDALTKIGRYFQSDYKFGNIEPTVDAEVLTTAIAKRLIGTPKSIKIPTRRVQATNQVLTRLNGRLDQAVALAAAVPHAEETAKDLSERAKKAEGKDKEALEGFAKRFSEAAAALKRAVASYEAFVTQITATPDATKAPLLSNIVLETAVIESIYDLTKGQQIGPDAVRDDTLVLEVSNKGTGGGYYTKKNLWTFFGSAPFYIMGSAVVNYTLSNPKTDELLATDAILIHGGYKKVHEVEEEFAPPKGHEAPGQLCE